MQVLHWPAAVDRHTKENLPCTCRLTVAGHCCSSGVDQFTCICPANFGGADCTEMQDPCDVGNPCNSHGDCFSQTHGGATRVGTIHCECDAGWTGPHCVHSDRDRPVDAAPAAVEGCPRAADGMFQCSARAYACSYVPISFVNDGKWDCPDGSDESNIAGLQGGGVPTVPRLPAADPSESQGLTACVSFRPLAFFLHFAGARYDFPALQLSSWRIRLQVFAVVGIGGPVRRQPLLGRRRPHGHLLHHWCWWRRVLVQLHDGICWRALHTKR